MDSQFITIILLFYFRMSSTWELITSFEQHISYVTENLDRLNNLANDLSAMHTKVIIKLRDEKVALMSEINQLKDEQQSNGIIVLMNY